MIKKMDGRHAAATQTATPFAPLLFFKGPHAGRSFSAGYESL